MRRHTFLYILLLSVCLLSCGTGRRKSQGIPPAKSQPAADTLTTDSFRYEAEKKVAEGKDVVYAIEEPETSQHNEHIRMMMDALKSLSARDHIQIIITTHSPYLVKQLNYAQLRMVSDNGGTKTIAPVDTASMPYVSLNEVSYLAFGDASEEYHDELY